MEIHGNFIFTKKNDNLGTSRADYPPETSSSRKATQKKSAGGNVQNSPASSEKKCNFGAAIIHLTQNF